MKKKIIIATIAVIILVIGGVLSVFIKQDLDYKKTDAYKFKNEYEAINNQSNDNGKTYRELNINKENKIVYATAKEIVDKTNNGDTFVVYFGFSKCPWCRSMIENLVEMSIDYDQKIYYVDVYDIRDKIEYKDGELVTTVKGDESYMKLIEMYSDVLNDYNLTVDDETINTGEKRIYAPNVVAVLNGKATKMVSGTSESLTDPYGKITNKMNEDSKKQLECIFNCLVEIGVCTKKGAC